MKTTPSISFLIACVLFSNVATAHDHALDTAATLDTVLAAQSDEHKARYEARNPKETLSFFEVKPGDRVLEASPGGGWYTQILIPVVGKSGLVLAVDYNPEIWAFFNVQEDFIEKRKTWTQTFPLKKDEWGVSGGDLKAATFGALPEELNGTMDKALFIRALHGMARNEKNGQFLSQAMSEAYKALKPGGILGIVQHAAREDRDDEWADGSAGYLKESAVKQFAMAAGFEFVASSDINANPKDQADKGDVVWRLPPSLSGDEANKEAMSSIGESNRMTLKFRKPLN